MTNTPLPRRLRDRDLRGFKLLALALIPALAVGCSKSNQEEGFTSQDQERVTAPVTATVESPAVQNETPVAPPAAGTAHAESPAAPPSEPPLQSWTTSDGQSFEARLVWISKSGTALRFELADGASKLYATGHLAEESQDLVRVRIESEGDVKVASEK